MPYNAKQKKRNGVDLDARTAEIERLALAGVYHYEIADHLGISVSSVEQTIHCLRRHGRVGSMRGPRKNVVGINWEEAAAIWSDLTVSVGDAVACIGCAERTIYRKPGPRGVALKAPVARPAPDIREVLRDEYVRLCERESALSVLQGRIEAEQPIIEARLEALRTTMKAFGFEDDDWCADSYIAGAYRQGLPLHFIAMTASSNFTAVEAADWTEAAVEAHAKKLGVKRPAGWTAEQADKDWAAADIEDVDWLDQPYGLPDPTVALDRPAPQLLLPAPQSAVETVDNMPPISVSVDKPSEQQPEPMPALPVERLVEPTPEPKDTRKKTPERVALLRELWFTRVTRVEILARLNALPGGEIPAKQLGAYVIQWGISQSAATRPDPIAKPIEPAIPEPEPVEEPEVQIPVETERPRTTIADLATRKEPYKPPEPKALPPVLRTAPVARATVAGLSAANGEPVRASMAAIQAWGAERGIITGRLDLDRVNAKRRQLQLPPFEIETIQRPVR